MGEIILGVLGQGQRQICPMLRFSPLAVAVRVKSMQLSCQQQIQGLLFPRKAAGHISSGRKDPEEQVFFQQLMPLCMPTIPLWSYGLEYQVYFHCQLLAKAQAAGDGSRRSFLPLLWETWIESWLLDFYPGPAVAVIDIREVIQLVGDLFLSAFHIQVKISRQEGGSVVASQINLLQWIPCGYWLEFQLLFF